MVKVKWDKIEGAEPTDDSRIYWTGWKMHEGMDTILGHYVACVKGDCYRVPLTNKIIQGDWKKEMKEARELMKEVCDYYEREGKWPQ